MDKAEKDKAKNVRRGAKGSLTRTMNATKVLIEARRSKGEVNEAFEEVKKAHKVLLTKHEEYAVLLDDEEFNDAEMWMQLCTSEYVACSIQCYDYVNEKDDDNETENVIEVVNNESSAPSDDGNTSNAAEGNIELPEQPTSNSNESNPTQAPEQTTSTPSSAKPFAVKHEKAKHPIF